MNEREFYPSISCDGEVGVFTVGTAEGCTTLLFTIGMILCLMYVGASHTWPEEETENNKKCLK